MNTTAATPSENPAPPPNGTKATFPERLTSLDAFRGFVMFLMMAEVLRFHRVADDLP
jgi:uncharacterized membrane protein